MFGLPTLFFCRIRLVKLLSESSQKPTSGPRLWTLNSTSTFQVVNMLRVPFQTSKAVSADTIGAPVRDHIEMYDQMYIHISNAAVISYHLINVEQLQGTLTLTWTIHRQCYASSQEQALRGPRYIHTAHTHCTDEICAMHGIKTTTGRFSKQTGQLLLVPCTTFLRVFRSGDSAFHIALTSNLLLQLKNRIRKESKPISSSFCCTAGNCSSKHFGLQSALHMNTRWLDIPSWTSQSSLKKSREQT